MYIYSWMFSMEMYVSVWYYKSKNIQNIRTATNEHGIIPKKTK